MNLPEVITTVDELQQRVAIARRSGARIGLVPTMGALHRGHVSLVEQSRAACDLTVTSIFVNPTQFAPHEDFQKYPRDLQTDLQLLAADRPGWVFAPSAAEMYPAGHQTTVDLGELTRDWEGRIRPTHFRGVATVVLKLFTASRPDVAYFGCKDFQQLRVIEQMTADLCLGIEIHRCPIIRDHDGIALSSRNRYLSPEERQRGLSLSRALAVAGAMIARGERHLGEIQSAMHHILRAAPVEIDYAVIVDQQTLRPLERLDRAAVALVAARVGATRLIDNLAFDSPTAEC